MSSTQASSETYTGSCHCQHFKYTVTHSPPLSDPICEVTECNCSICTRNGYLLIYVEDSDIVVKSGGEDEYKACSSSKLFYPSDPFILRIRSPFISSPPSSPPL